MLEKAVYSAFAIFLLAFSGWPGGSSNAHEGATGVVKQRMEAMKSMEKRMKTLASMLKGKQKLDFIFLETSAQEITQHAKQLPELFPKGSGGHPSEALPTVWAEHQRFRELANQLSGKAAELATNAKTGKRENIIPPFSAVAKACKACHDDFKKEK